MLDALVDRAKAVGIFRILGYYSRTAKNGMVADHYAKLGFNPEPVAIFEDCKSSWSLDVSAYKPRNTHIQVRGLAHA